MAKSRPRGAAVKEDVPNNLSNSSLIHEIRRQWYAERPDLNLQNFMMQIYLQRIGRIIEGRFEKWCQAHFSLRPQDMRLLFALRRGGSPFSKRPTDLFKALLVTSGAITKQVDRLVKKRLVRRLADPDYRGGFLVQLTDRGLEVADRATTLLATDSFIGSTMAAMSREDRDRSERFCLSLIKTLEGADHSQSVHPVRRIRAASKLQTNRKRRTARLRGVAAAASLRN